MTKTSEKYGYDSTFPTRFRDLLDFNKVTQQKMAEICSVKPQSVSQWRNGETRPDILSLSKIAQHFNVSTDYLLGLTDIKSTDKATKELCSTLGLSEDTIKVLSADTSSSIAKRWEKIINSDMSEETEELKQGELAMMTEGISAFVCNVFDRLIDDLRESYNMSTDEYIGGALIDTLDHFFSGADSTEFKMHEKSNEITIPAETILSAYSKDGKMDLHPINLKELLLNSHINSIVARLNYIKNKAFYNQEKWEDLEATFEI